MLPVQGTVRNRVAAVPFDAVIPAGRRSRMQVVGVFVDQHSGGGVPGQAALWGRTTVRLPVALPAAQACSCHLFPASDPNAST